MSEESLQGLWKGTRILVRRLRPNVCQVLFWTGMGTSSYLSRSLLMAPSFCALQSMSNWLKPTEHGIG